MKQTKIKRNNVEFTVGEAKAAVNDLAKKAAINGTDLFKMIDDDYLDSLEVDEILSAGFLLTSIVESQDQMFDSIKEKCVMPPEANEEPENFSMQVKEVIMDKLLEIISDLEIFQSALVDHLDNDDGVSAILENSTKPLHQVINYLKEHEGVVDTKGVS